MDRTYETAWREGVDRWFGQTMTSEQLNIINHYSIQTHMSELPQWVYGLRYTTPGSEYGLYGRYLQWDYGLTMDLELVCHHRGGPLPVEFMPHLWTILTARRERLGTSMNDTLMSCPEETIT